MQRDTKISNAKALPKSNLRMKGGFKKNPLQKQARN